MYVSRESSERRHAEIIASEPAGLGATRANLSRLLRTLDFVGWSTHEESGRLDRRALTRYATGSVNIFSRRDIKESEKTAVSILIDCSGSMDNERIVIAQEFAVHLSRLLNRARVPFAVTGFHRERGNQRFIDSNSVITSVPVFIPFKRWGESYGRSIAKLGAINQVACGGTPDYSAIHNALDEISQREENRKLLFVLTDADGYAVQQIKHLQTMADSLGVTIIAIGVGRTDVEKCFTNAENITDIKDLASASFNRLLKTVEKNAR